MKLSLPRIAVLVGDIDVLGLREQAALLPGTFRFSIGAFANAFAEGTPTSSETVVDARQFDAAFTLTPVAATPEPATFALLGTGLVALLRVRRRATEA